MSETDCNRRDFVKIGMGAAAVAALPQILKAQQAPALAKGAYYRAGYPCDARRKPWTRRG